MEVHFISMFFVGYLSKTLVYILIISIIHSIYFQPLFFFFLLFFLKLSTHIITIVGHFYWHWRTPHTPVGVLLIITLTPLFFVTSSLIKTPFFLQGGFCTFCSFSHSHLLLARPYIGIVFFS